jgi:dolichol-phosphate mannosyltransferase
MKFYAVGAMGMAVHLTLLSLFVRVLQMHYQWATVFAVEAAVVHNFLWHRRWTWADRRVDGAAATAARLVRFNLTNGLVSVLGNLFFMHLFAGLLRFDPIVASLLSIPPCALVNFLVSDRWVFLSPGSTPRFTSNSPAVGETAE